MACEIVQTAADAIGTGAMTAIVAELLASPTPVGATDWLVEVAVASDAQTVDVLRSRIAEAGFRGLSSRALRRAGCGLARRATA